MHTIFIIMETSETSPEQRGRNYFEIVCAWISGPLAMAMHFFLYYNSLIWDVSKSLNFCIKNALRLEKQILLL